MSLEWTYGRVSKFTKDGFTQTCTYDANGIRTEKIENGKTHKYYVEDSRIVREVVTGSENYELYYLYGANGIAGFTHKTANGSTTYYYRKNLLGLLRRSMTPRAYAKRSMRMTHGGIAR